MNKYYQQAVRGVNDSDEIVEVGNIAGSLLLGCGILQ